jgi:hypothetical protein
VNIDGLEAHQFVRIERDEDIADQPASFQARLIVKAG